MLLLVNPRFSFSVVAYMKRHFFIVDFSKRISRLNVTFLGHFFPIGRVYSHKQVTVGKTIDHARVSIEINMLKLRLKAREIMP